MVGNYITSFIGFLPADNPKVVVYIAIDNAKGVTQYGGTIAAPIAKKVMQDIIQIKDIKKSKNVTPRTYNYYDVKTVKVPNIINKTVNEAIKELDSFKLEIESEGSRIIYQSPEAGKTVNEGSKIRVLLGN